MTTWPSRVLVGAILLAGVAGSAIFPSAVRADVGEREDWALSLALTNETLGFYPNAAHPGAEASIELRYVRDGAYELVQTVRLGLVHHPEVMTGGYLGTSLVNRAVLPFGLYGELGLGVGYSLSGSPVTTYVAGDANEGFVPGGDEPRSMARITLSAAVGFDFAEAGAPGLRVFIRYREAVLTPFAPGNSFDLFVSAQLALGVSVPLSQEGWQ